MRKKETSIRDLFAKVADNLNQAGVLPPVAREWTAKGVQSAYYRIKDQQFHDQNVVLFMTAIYEAKKELNY